MARRAAERVTDVHLDKVGDGLRTVVIVQADGFEVTYLDDDLKKRYSRRSFSDVVDTFRLERPFLDPEVDEYPVGDRRAIVHYHTHAFVLQFPFSETETILISVTREVGRDLLGFFEDCRQLVHSEKAGEPSADPLRASVQNGGNRRARSFSQSTRRGSRDYRPLPHIFRSETRRQDCHFPSC